jgi:hypothetical protein
VIRKTTAATTGTINVWARGNESEILGKLIDYRIDAARIDGAGEWTDRSRWWRR